MEKLLLQFDANHNIASSAEIATSQAEPRIVDQRGAVKENVQDILPFPSRKMSTGVMEFATFFVRLGDAADAFFCMYHITAMNI